ncbi:unnamed protein product [Orchesella dallaii]|uniref:Uncharacterized protein n=1 Tax=Orchesella dallaii TaxID=48710 RepID=A0ABP1S487_9HEXA
MLKEQHVALVQLEKLVFAFMHPLPVEWNRDYTELVTTNSHCRRLPWALSMIWGIPFGIASFYSSIFSAYYPQPGRLQRVDTIFHFAVGVLTSITIVSSLQSFKEPSCRIGYNALNKFAWKLSKEYKFANKPDSIMITTSMVTVLGAFFVPIIFIFGTVATELDAFFFIIEPMLPDPVDRDRLE